MKRAARVRWCLTAAALAALMGTSGGGATTGSSAIVGGTAINVTSAPWAVFVTIGSGATADHCTGDVLDPTHVLVAGHCVFHGTGLAALSTLAVRAGISNANGPVTPSEQDRGVSSYRVHPGFRNTGLDAPDDVAVLTLSAPLDLSTPEVQAVGLPKQGMPIPAGREIVLAGFGHPVPHEETFGPLKEMTAIVERAGFCGPYTTATFYAGANGVFLCAYAPVASACGGDSGDGFVTASEPRVVLGVLEDGDPGCGPKTMEIGAYVGAPEILDFINGSNHPPTAPRLTATTTLNFQAPSPLQVADTVWCTASGWPSSTQVSYSLLDVTTGQVLRQGAGGAFTIPASSAGDSVLCEATLTNAGGSLVVDSSSTSAVQPSA